MNEYLYQKHNQFFSQYAYGSAKAAKDELIELGAKNIKDGYLGYYFQIKINDLYSLVLPRISDLQIPNNVHFKEKGSEFLANLVVKSIMESL